MDGQEFITTTAQLPENPMITIKTEALGVLCFNDEATAKRAEIGYLDIHDVFISIFNSTTNEVIHAKESMRDKDLEIISSTEHIGERYENGDADDRNFSRMFELTELYNDRDVDFADDADSRFQSRLYVNDAVFSTDPESVARAIVFPEDDPTSIKSERRTGRVLKVFSKNRDLSLRFGGEEIPLNPTESYLIVVENGNCRASPEDGDFKHYFDILKNPGRARHNIRFEPTPAFLPSSETEQMYITDLTSKIIACSRDAEEPYENRVELARQLENFAAVFRCPPAACQKAAFANKSRKIPG